MHCMCALRATVCGVRRGYRRSYTITMHGNDAMLPARCWYISTIRLPSQEGRKARPMHCMYVLRATVCGARRGYRRSYTITMHGNDAMVPAWCWYISTIRLPSQEGREARPIDIEPSCALAGGSGGPTDALHVRVACDGVRRSSRLPPLLHHGGPEGPTGGLQSRARSACNAQLCRRAGRPDRRSVEPGAELA